MTFDFTSLPVEEASRMLPESFSSFNIFMGYVFLFILNIINSYREYCASEHQTSVKVSEK